MVQWAIALWTSFEVSPSANDLTLVTF